MTVKRSLFKNIESLTAVIAICLTVNQLSLAQSNVKNPDPVRFKNEINEFTKWDTKNSFPEHAILFVGSSSIRFWKSHDSFPDYPIINRGFGGSHISDVLYYYDQVIKKYQPSIFVVDHVITARTYF